MSPTQNNKVNFLPKECRQQLSDCIIIFLFHFDSVSTAAIIETVTVELLMKLPKTRTSYEATSRSLATRYHDNCTGRSGQQDEEQEEEQQLSCCKDLQQSFHLFSYNICIHTNPNLHLKQNQQFKNPTDSTNQVPVWSHVVSTLLPANGSIKFPVPSGLNQHWLPVYVHQHSFVSVWQKVDFAHAAFRSLTLKRSDSYFLSLDSLQTAPFISDAENDSSNHFKIFQITS